MDLRATNGRFAAAQDFYVDSYALTEFASGLTSFPTSIEGEVRLELGVPSGDWAYYILLRAFLYDRTGHAALGVVVDNHMKNPFGQQSSFQILCEVAAINRLGVELGEWAKDPTSCFVWTPKSP